MSGLITELAIGDRVQDFSRNHAVVIFFDQRWAWVKFDDETQDIIRIEDLFHSDEPSA